MIPLRLVDGRALPRSIGDFDVARTLPPATVPKAVCYAPFVTMDFGPTGDIRVCGCMSGPVANVRDGQTLLDIWQGQALRRLRALSTDYTLDQALCQHCISQIDAGTRQPQSMAFDWLAADAQSFDTPRQLHFRLNSTCNLACVMCYPETSSRIRQERLGLPPLPSVYDDRFFDQLEELLPHVRHVAFSGGEPFMVREHWRVFDLLERHRPDCDLYANTNAALFLPRARQAIERLNFRHIAVSMDAVSADVHERVRRGIDHAAFLRNLDYLLDLRRHKPLTVLLNVTEHRLNWFELPAIFAFAAERELDVHVSYCIHPEDVSLYTLPTPQLRAIHEQLRHDFDSRFPPTFRNQDVARALLGYISGELARRTDGD